jgi:lipoate-protein ligase A
MRIEAAGKPEGSKLIRLSAEIEAGRVARLRIRGDFFASPLEGFDRVEARLAGVPITELAAAFDALLIEEGVEAYGISGAALAAVLDEALHGV